MSLHIISIPPRKRTLYQPNQPSLLHPLHRNLSLLACLVDGATIQWQKMWKTLSTIHGQKIQENNTEHFSVNGNNFIKIAVLVQQMHQSQKAQNSDLRFTKKDSATQSSTLQRACYPCYYQDGMGQNLANTHYHTYAQRNFQEPLCISKIYGNLRPRPCFKFPKILTILEQYQTEMTNT